MSISLFSLLDDILNEDHYARVIRSRYRNVVEEPVRNGKLHGKVVYTDKPEEYFIEGRLVSKSDWESYCRDEEDNRTHYLLVDGVRYKTTGKKLREIKKYLE